MGGARGRVIARHEYFTYNVMGLMGTMCTSGFLAFALDPEEFADRSSIVLTLLLTAVSFKYVVSESLPKVRLARRARLPAPHAPHASRASLAREFAGSHSSPGGAVGAPPDGGA